VRGAGRQGAALGGGGSDVGVGVGAGGSGVGVGVPGAGVGVAGGGVAVGAGVATGVAFGVGLGVGFGVGLGVAAGAQPPMPAVDPRPVEVPPPTRYLASGVTPGSVNSLAASLRIAFTSGSWIEPRRS
jgi:hypothetical protein